MEKINIKELQGSQSSDEEDEIPYRDIQMIAEKINEIIDELNEIKKDY